MRNPKSKLQFTDVNFRAAISVHDRSIFVGYADATLVVHKALPGGEDLRMRIRGIEVKVLASGPRIDFKSVKATTGERAGEWFPTMFPQSGNSRRALTEALVAVPAVAHALAAATPLLAEQDAAAAAAGSDEIPF